jgi:CheY-like chemotaxis protein
VVTNLLSNAMKFSPADGVVEIHVSRSVRQVRVEVRDRGPGIPEEFRKRIFQKFSQADSSDTRQKGGTGLGLNISRAIIERLGGSIGFDTRTGEGTTFFFELPEWQEPPPTVTSVLHTGLPRILICEDDRDIARLISLMLEKAGFDPDTVQRRRGHGAAGARALRRHHGRPEAARPGRHFADPRAARAAAHARCACRGDLGVGRRRPGAL